MDLGAWIDTRDQTHGAADNACSMGAGGAAAVNANDDQASDYDNGDGHGDTDTGFTLQSIKLTIKSGQLVGTVGPIWSSKSSLLMATLREITPHGLAGSRLKVTIPAGTMAVEMDRDETSVKVEGRLAYAPQEAWIQSGTVRNNILFGKRWIARASRLNMMPTHGLLSFLPLSVTKAPIYTVKRHRANPEFIVYEVLNIDVDWLS